MNTEENINVFRRVISEGFNKGEYRVLPESYNPDFVEHQFG